MEFHGVKVACIFEDKLLVHLRDNKPGLFNANKWDVPGGGREGNETPVICAIREVKEEFGITLESSAIVWQKQYPAQKDPSQIAFFFVATISQTDVDAIVLGEGQHWGLMDFQTFFNHADVIDALKQRFRDYLITQSA